EFIAFAAVGGSSGGGVPVGALGGVSLPTDANGRPLFDLPAGRIDLVGITLDVFGPKGLNGPQILVDASRGYGTGTVNGTFQPLIDPGPNNLIDTMQAGGALVPLPMDTTPDDAGVTTLLNGTPEPEGFLV